MSLTIHSSAFNNDGAIPKKHTGDGDDLSPPLSWSGLPAETRELALICDDPDAPVTEPWVHWVLYKLPADVTKLDAGIPPTGRVAKPAGAIQGKNSWGTVGYRGPAPPRGHGVHHYHFKLYALDSEVELAGELTKDELLSRIKSHVIAEGELTGTYQR
ncbi:MAG: YbhB/YbcL family Raf kinase inhibitor-like protein [Phycisphaerae bacterium]|nr:YbhB/YbcL family Raf kinase inhibitor-like protein [Phycisphaerae bacterium]